MNTQKSVKKGIIYQIYFPNGKLYVGLTTKSLSHRVKSYEKEIKCVSRTRPVVRALRKYGLVNCKFTLLDVVENCSREELGNLEKVRIHQMKSLLQQGGYNLHEGGYGGDNFTNNPNKEVIRKKLKGRQGRLGAKLSQKTKNKISKKARQRLKDKTRHPLWGKKHSLETRQKLSEQKKGIVPLCTKFREVLSFEQLVGWFEAKMSYREFLSLHKISQRKVEESLQTHFGTKSLRKARESWKKSSQE